jgi:acetyltransferase-like isoleucine patch superfamily enzyme
VTVLEHDWYPAALPDNVTVGRGSWLWSSYAFIHYRSRRPRGVSIGDHTGVYETTFFGLGPRGEVQIGDYCTVVGVTFCTNHRVTIGDHSLVSKPVTIADTFAATPLLNVPEDDAADDPATSVAIGSNVWIGAGVVLLSGADIGDGAIIGAATVVDRAVPPYAIVAGNPMRIVGWARPTGEEPAP